MQPTTATTHAAAFVEAGGGSPGTGAVAIASFPSITDADNATLASAKVVLTNAKAGDVLSIAGGLPARRDVEHQHVGCWPDHADT